MKRYTPLLLSAALLVSGAAFAAELSVPIPTTCQEYVDHPDRTQALLSAKNAGKVQHIAKKPSCQVVVEQGSQAAIVTFKADNQQLRCVNVASVGVIGASCYVSRS